MSDKGSHGVQGEGDPSKSPGPEAVERGAPRAHTPAEHHANKAKTEKNLDSGLEETFPASDPVSISPGAD